MTKDELYNKLNYVNHSRDNRSYFAALLLENPDYIQHFLDIMFMVDDKSSHRAAWVFEFMCGKNLEAALPHLDYFTKNMHRVHHHSAVRPVAKICEYLAKAFYSKTDTLDKVVLKPIYQERIIEVCFDYMIGPQHKIAPKAYSMNTLFLFGRDHKWIHPELAIILERDFQLQSSGFKARARHILKKIKN
ncbi:adenylosuccinate lyase [uncultured Winogradskyella sp.]|uniref:adenylosuccinate lyase n=1 Tax=uncultured Winogradskyella sp. TaxID=395353 RepID=UPI0026081D16|nr:adenylosuccinate lyase [uncultured Winogradskyella sp.]